MSETEYVSQMLTKIKRFAQHHDVHVWFVAHPRQLRDWRGQPPTMYDISGSAHFINKADNGVVIHRNRDPQAGPMNQVRLITDSLSQPISWVQLAACFTKTHVDASLGHHFHQPP